MISPHFRSALCLFIRFPNSFSNSHLLLLLWFFFGLHIRLLGCKYLTDLLDDVSLAAFGVSAAALHDLAVAVADEHVGNHLDTQGTEHVAVGVEQDVVLPLVGINEGLDLVDLLCLVNADGKELHAGLLLPLLVDLGDGAELAVAGLAPGGKETDHEGFAVVAECVGTDYLTLEILDLDLGQLGESGHGQHEHGKD